MNYLSWPMALGFTLKAAFTAVFARIALPQEGSFPSWLLLLS